MIEFYSQVLLSSFYGYRLWIFLMFCAFTLVEMPIMENWYIFLRNHSHFDLVYGALCFILLLHWIAMFIPKEKIYLRYLVPCILYVFGICIQVGFNNVSWKNILTGLILTLTCYLFFLLMEAVKTLLSKYKTASKVVRVVCNIIISLCLVITVLSKVSCI